MVCGVEKRMSANNVIQLFVERESSERTEMQSVEHVAQQLLLEVEGKDEVSPFTIRDDGDYEVACDLLTHVKRQIKDIEERRKKVTKPLNDALNAFREMYRPTLTYYARAEAKLKLWTGSYVVAKRRKEEEAMRQIAAATQRGDFDTAMEVSQKTETPPERKDITISERWGYEVMDIDEVPEKYIIRSVDSAMLAQHARGKAEPEPIPGIRFFRKQIVSARTK